MEFSLFKTLVVCIISVIFAIFLCHKLFIRLEYDLITNFWFFMFILDFNLVTYI
jgi:hypothetical protein